MLSRILVCTDGEPHSTAAIQWAIRLGLSLQAEVTALHVIDPYLKKFYDELYAQGRRQYLQYVDESMQAVADRAGTEFTKMCRSQGLEAKFNVRYGEPLQEIRAELQQVAPQLVITGGKKLNAWGRFRSRNLPACLQKKAATPIPIVCITDPYNEH